MEQQTNFQFDGQRPDEQILVLFRRHYSDLVVIGLRNLALIVIVLLVSFKFLAESFIPLGIGLALFLALAWGYHLALWYYSFYIITNQRLRYTQRSGLFRQTVLDLNLDSIELVRYQTSGFLSEMVGYGDLIIDSTTGELTISKIKQAKELYNLLQDLTKRDHKNHETVTQN